MSLILSGTDGLSDVDGSAATPAIRGTDANTGIFFPAADTIAFAEGGAEVARFDSSGNFGLGVTPSAWATYKAIDVLGYASFSSYNGNEADMSTNAYYNAGWKYKNTAAATLYQQDAGVHRWQYAASGTAGNAITFTQAMTLDASGNLGIGTTSPSALRLTLEANGNQLRLRNTTTRYRSDLSVNATGTAEWNCFDDSGGVYMPMNLAGSVITFGTGSGSSPERARIDSSGNLLVGTTTNAGGYRIRAIGDSSGATGFQFDKGASTTATCVEIDVGANNATQKALLVYSGALATDTMYVYSNGNIVNRNNSYGTLSDVKLKENIVDATPKLNDVLQLQVRNFNLKDSPKSKQIGFIAQEFEQVFPSMVDESTDMDKEGNDLGTTTKSIKTSVLIPVLVKAIQEQQAIIQSLTDRITALESA